MSQSVKKRNILVTGGAGYIGSMLVDLLLKQGFRVRVLDSLLFGRKSLSQAILHSNFELQQGDICDNVAVDKAMDEMDSVVHLAAIVGEPACNRDEKRAHSVNTNGSHLLCDAALRSGVERFVFASTCSNYGRMQKTSELIDESAKLQPLSVYSITKVEFERHLLSLEVDAMHPTCLRFATAYGLSFRPRFDLTVNEFTRELTMGRDLEVYGEQFWRPYCHVGDIARACLAVLVAPLDLISHQAFNVGDSEENYQKRQLVDLIDRRLPGSKSRVRFVKKGQDMRDYRVSFAKLSSRLDFQIEKRVPDGIEEIVSALQDGKLTDPDNPLYSNV